MAVVPVIWRVLRPGTIAQYPAAHCRDPAPLCTAGEAPFQTALGFGFWLIMRRIGLTLPPTRYHRRPGSQTGQRWLVTIFLLIMLNYLANLKDGEQPKVWVLTLLSVFAMMSKESGLILPLLSIYYLFFEVDKKSRKLSSIVIIVLFCCWFYTAFSAL